MWFKIRNALFSSLYGNNYFLSFVGIKNMGDCPVCRAKQAEMKQFQEKWLTEDPSKMAALSVHGLHTNINGGNGLVKAAVK